MDHCPNRQMSYGFIPLNSFGKLLLLLQEEPRGSSLWKTTTNRATKTKKGRRNHKVVLNKLKKRIGEKKKEKASNTISFIVSRANSGSKIWFLSGKNTILAIQIVFKIVFHFVKNVV
ncbi:LOW QUALITY PROTEIN: uncharacterized protein [Drosophila suzukii]|uniref:LOW QUALITY PROTEIN: uncharacterized protein n=1 Tax=Drosophila suzukii TaxID=28584 RepID=A0ABM4TS58_DROSZ